jgi:hypothetical protein
MKIALSYAVMLIPILWVVLRAGDRFNKEKLKYLSIALTLSGISTAIGAKFFGLYAIGRHSVLEGDKALIGAAAVVILGVAILTLHYLVAYLRARKRK